VRDQFDDAVTGKAIRIAKHPGLAMLERDDGIDR